MNFIWGKSIFKLFIYLNEHDIPKSYIIFLKCVWILVFLSFSFSLLRMPLLPLLKLISLSWHLKDTSKSVHLYGLHNQEREENCSLALKDHEVFKPPKSWFVSWEGQAESAFFCHPRTHRGMRLARNVLWFFRARKILVFHIAQLSALVSPSNDSLCFLSRGTIPVRVPEAARLISAAPQ